MLLGAFIAGSAIVGLIGIYQYFFGLKKLILDVYKSIPQEQWGDLTDVLIAHGRTICDARKPKCGICAINYYCRYFLSLKKG